MSEADAAKAKIRGRFFVEPIEDEWQVVDDKWSTCISFESKRRALAEATFLRAYVKKWGDVNLHSVPNSIDDPFTDDDRFMLAHNGVARDDVSSLYACADESCECRTILRDENVKYHGTTSTNR